MSISTEQEVIDLAFPDDDTKNFNVHGSVNPVDRSHIYVGSVSSESYVSATLAGDGVDNTSYEDDSVLLVKRLS